MSEQIIQGTDAWKMLRLGKVTASRVKDIIAITKSGYATSRDKYMTQLLLVLVILSNNSCVMYLSLLVA